MSKKEELSAGPRSGNDGVNYSAEPHKKNPSESSHGERLNEETTARQNRNTAGSRFGDTLSDGNKPGSLSPNMSNHTPMSSTKFGEELIGRERSNYHEDITTITTTDDLTDDNDALTERPGLSRLL